ncbi:MAG: SUMF1/EgtB/PvdO family nonheme iron enzyme [Anaerolineales bacterium]
MIQRQSPNRITFYMSGGVLLVLLIVVLWWVFRDAPQAAPPVPTVRPTEVIARPSPTQSPSPSATARPSPTPSPSPTQTPTSLLTATRTPVALTPTPELPPLPGRVAIVLGDAITGGGVPPTLGRFGGLYDNPRLIAAGHIMLTVPGDERMPTFHIDAYEVINQQLVMYINQSGLTDLPLAGWAGANWLASEEAPLRQLASGEWTIRAPEWATLPAHGVSAFTARAYCANLGGALPTLAQWERAAYWQADGPARAYPWGEAPIDRTRAHFDAEGPLSRDALAAGTSWVGAYHLLGNVAEWVRLPGDTFGIIGGAFRDAPQTFVATAQDVRQAEPGLAEPGVGFRCVRADDTAP